MRTAFRLCAVLSFLAAPLVAQNVDVTGTWSGAYTLVERSQPCPATTRDAATAAFIQTGTSVAGTVTLSAIPMDVTAPDCKVLRTDNVTLLIRGTVSGSAFSGGITVPDDDGSFEVPFTASISGDSMSITLGNDEFTLSVSMRQTSTTAPAGGLSGTYKGNHTGASVACGSVITFSGEVAASITQVGDAVFGSLSFTGFRTDEIRPGQPCRVIDEAPFTIPLIASISGSSIVGVLLDDEDEVPFKATVSGNTITGVAGELENPDRRVQFTITRTSGPPPTPQPSITSFRASPSTINAGESSTLSWSTLDATSVTIDNGVGAVSSSGSTTVRPSTTTTYTLTASGAGGSASSRTTVTIASAAPARVVISALPRGLLQAAGQGGAVDSFALTNLGESATTVSLTPSGNFFTIGTTSLALGPNDAATVTITGLAQPAGTFEGSVAVNGSGASGLVVPVRLLSAAPETARVIAAPETARAEVSAPPGQQTTTGSVAFTNSGAGTLTALAVSDVPFITPQAGVVAIGPGQTRSVSFTVDNARRPDAAVPLGAATGKISLSFFSGLPGPGAFADGPAASTSVSVTVAHVVRPGVAAGPPPPLPSGQIALFIPAVGNRARAVADLLLASRQSTPLTDVRIFLSGGGVAQIASIAQLVPNSSVALPGLVKNVFGATLTTASAQIRTADVSRLSVGAVQSNLASPTGTYGTTLPVFRSDRVGGSPQIVLGGMAKSGSLRTDLYVQEVSGTAATFDLELLDGAGAVVSRRTGLNVAAFDSIELQDVAALNVAAGRVVGSGAGAGQLAAYALVTDATTGDAWLITDPGWEFSSDTFFVPLLSAGPAAQTQLFMTSRSATPVQVSTEVRGAAGRRRAVGTPATTPRVTTSTLQSAQTSALDASAVSAGYIRVTAPPRSVSIAARSTRSGGGGVFGASLPVVAASSALRNGESKRFAGVEDASSASRAGRVPSTFRSSLALIETANAGATLRVTLQFTVGGGSLATAQGRASREVTIGASEFVLLSDIARQLIGPARESIGDLRNMLLDVEVIGGSGRVIPFVQSFDNGSGDMIVRVD